jgi:hypothetical protein
MTDPTIGDFARREGDYNAANVRSFPRPTRVSDEDAKTIAVLPFDAATARTALDQGLFDWHQGGNNRHSVLRRCVRIYPYATATRDADGNVVYDRLVARYDPDPDNGKPDKAFGEWRLFNATAWSAPRWLKDQSGYPTHEPDNWSLYNLIELTENPTMPALIVEGEKAADAARRLLAGIYIVTTTHGGARPGGAAT